MKVVDANVLLYAVNESAEHHNEAVDWLDAALKAVLDYPAFAVFGVPGIVLALAGRKPRRERYLRADQI